jgi:hypothetical protein
MIARLFNRLCFALTLCFFGSQSVFAQIPSKIETTTDDSIYLVVTADGTEYVGIFLSQDSNAVWLQTHSLGKIQILIVDIKSIEPYDAKSDPQMETFNRGAVFNTRHQLTTSSFPIKKGENYAMCNLYGPEVHFAVHKDFSVGVMTTWIASPLVLALKYTRGTANPKINYGFGTLLGNSVFYNEAKGYGGLHLGMITYGTRQNNLTLSLGYGYFDVGRYYKYKVLVPGVYQAIDGERPPIPVLEEIKVNQNLFQAETIGLAGQIRLKKNVSFVYDCLLIFTQTVPTRDGIQKIFPESANVNGQWTLQQITVKPFEEYQYEIEKTNVFIFMPSIRVQKTESRSFQFGLTGLIFDGNPNLLPMASWFFRL